MNDTVKTALAIAIIAALVGLIALLVVVPIARSEEICFEVPVARQLLEAVEEGKFCEAERAALETGSAEQAERIKQLASERDRCLENGEKAAKSCQEAVKAAKGSWWSRLKSGVSWMGAGATLALIAVLLI